MIPLHWEILYYLSIQQAQLSLRQTSGGFGLPRWGGGFFPHPNELLISAYPENLVKNRTYGLRGSKRGLGGGYCFGEVGFWGKGGKHILMNYLFGLILKIWFKSDCWFKS